MIAAIQTASGKYTVDFSKPIDLSIPLNPWKAGVSAFHAPVPAAEPVRSGTFTGSVKEGGPVNFFNVLINPHGNGTHTECVGHITEGYTINDCLKDFFFTAELITIAPERHASGDDIISAHQLAAALGDKQPQALIIRTLPNGEDKLQKNYSGINPPYFHHDAASWLVEKNIIHVLTDLPSMDREDDGGRLLFHKTFWCFPQAIRKEATITEMIYAADSINDGSYFLNLQIASFEMDASPSKPVLFRMQQV